MIAEDQSNIQIGYTGYRLQGVVVVVVKESLTQRLNIKHLFVNIQDL